MALERPVREVDRRRPETDEAVISLWLHGKAEHTQRSYAFEIKRFADFVKTPLRAVTLADVQDFSDALATSDLAPSSQGHALAAVKSLLTFAHRIGYLPVNVGAAERLPHVKDTLAERIVDVATIRRIIEGETNPRNQTMLRLLYYGCLRRAELAGLRWRDVSERDDGAQVTVFGKGGKTRTVVLPPAVAKPLLASSAGASPDDPLFPGRHGGSLTDSQIWRIVKAAGKRAGVPRLSPHWMRHAGASHAVDSGAPLTVVRESLGHSSLATTSRYLHARPGDSLSRYLPTI